MTFGIIFKADGVLIVIVLISIQRYKLVVSNDILKSGLLISSVYRYLLLFVFQILTMLSLDADVCYVKSCEKTIKLTESQ